MPDPRLAELTRDVNEQVLDRSIRHATFLERLKAGEVAKTTRFLDEQVFPDLVARTRARLSLIKARGFDTGPASTRRIQEMLASTDKVIASGYRELARRNIGGLHKLALSEAEFARAMLGQAVPAAFGLDLVTPSGPLLRSIVTSRPMRGRILKEWYEGLTASTQIAVRSEILIGLAQGEAQGQIVRRLVGSARSGITGVLNTSRRGAASIVRTSVNHVTTQAREMVYEENSDLVKSVRYLATLDDRTTIICISLDGQQFPINVGPRPPQHHS